MLNTQGVQECADRIQEQAQMLLEHLRQRFGSEGLTALDDDKHRPGNMTPWQQATASHIRAALGPERFWLGEALQLWKNTNKEPPPPDHSGPKVPEPSPPSPIDKSVGRGP